MSPNDSRDLAREHELVQPLLPYLELGALPDAERARLERHVLACDACFEELERASAPVRILRSHGLALLEARAAPRAPIPFLRSLVLGRPLAFAAACVLLVGSWVLLRPDGTRDLASFPREPVAVDVPRGGAAGGGVQDLFAAGAGYLDIGKYEEADARFRAVLEKSPDHQGAAYLLGLTRARAGRFTEALDPLDRALRGDDRATRSKALWVQANVYVRLDRTEDAERSLAALLATTDGPHREEARRLLDALRR